MVIQIVAGRGDRFIGMKKRDSQSAPDIDKLVKLFPVMLPIAPLPLTFNANDYYFTENRNRDAERDIRMAAQME
jgi:hypothetical protein